MREAGQHHLFQRRRLARDGRGDARFAMAEQVGPPAADRIQVAPPVVRRPASAFAAADRHQRQGVGMLAPSACTGCHSTARSRARHGVRPLLAFVPGDRLSASVHHIEPSRPVHVHAVPTEPPACPSSTADHRRVESRLGPHRAKCWTWNSATASAGVTSACNSRGHGAVMVVPMLDADTVLLVREYAAGMHRYELGLVKGRIDAGETPAAGRRPRAEGRSRLRRAPARPICARSRWRRPT